MGYPWFDAFLSGSHVLSERSCRWVCLVASEDAALGRVTHGLPTDYPPRAGEETASRRSRYRALVGAWAGTGRRRPGPATSHVRIAWLVSEAPLEPAGENMLQNAMQCC